MTVSNISFGRKIPITKCRIKDLKENRFVSATFYELDCNDRQDEMYIENLNGVWRFKDTILNNIQDSIRMPKSARKYKKYSFYILKKDDGPIVGLCQTSRNGENLNLEYLESEHEKKYKYIGQTMMASIVNVAKQKKFKNLYIPNPIDEAYDFYRCKCGFKPIGDHALFYRAKKAKKLQKKVENETLSPILDLIA